jgi:hypothetical protein
MAFRGNNLNDQFDNDLTVLGTLRAKSFVGDGSSLSGISTGGATGSFLAASGETITVVNGLITFITSSTFLILLEIGDKILMENGDNMQNG